MSHKFFLIQTVSLSMKQNMVIDMYTCIYFAQSVCIGILLNFLKGNLDSKTDKWISEHDQWSPTGL